MKKVGKTILIIVLVAVIAFGGYWAYQEFFVNKFVSVEEEKGWEMYTKARSASVSTQYFYVSYNSMEDFDEEIEKKGYITRDKYGYYHEFNGDVDGYTYVVKTGASSYSLYEFEDYGTSSKYQNTPVDTSTYNSKYVPIENVEHLSFLDFTAKGGIENEIRKYYKDGIIENESITHAFGTVKDTYVWKITFKCTYIHDGKTYKSKLVEEIHYDSQVRKVTISREDKELNAKGKVARKGDKNEVEITLKLAYKTNQTVVQRDFSDLKKA